MSSVVSFVQTFQSFDDVAQTTEDLIAKFPKLKDVELGLTELMVNAIEHGNLEITYDEKSKILQSGTFIAEIDSRLKLEKYKDREARIEVMDYTDELVVMISDQGSGFAWKEFLDRKLVDVTGLHGRGMLLSENQFKTMTYVGKGNKVVAVVG